MVSSSLRVHLRRRYKASREAIFEAFTDPAILPRWFSPSLEISMSVLAFELKESGKYRFAYTLPDGHVTVVTGEYRQIAPPRKLILTWTWEAPDPHAGMETLVTIELLQHHDEVEVVVTHERFPTAEVRDRHNEGWKGALDGLEQLLHKL